MNTSEIDTSPANAGQIVGRAATETTGCTCKDCGGACEYRPGWFMPGEIEGAAKLLGLELEDFKRQFLSEDWWVDDDAYVSFLAPAIVGYEGKRYPNWPTGRCTFYRNNRCMIHAAKPYECRKYMHGDSDATVRARHHEIGVAWKKHNEDYGAK